MRLECTLCKEFLPVEKFSVQSKNKKRGGYAYKCKDCHNTYVREIWYTKNREKQIASSNKWSRTNNTKVLANKYKCSEELIIELHSRGKCDLCESTDNLHIDHCHDTGKVRGILCRKCNLSLGGFKDNIIVLAKAIDYLRAGGQVSS